MSLRHYPFVSLLFVLYCAFCSPAAFSQEGWKGDLDAFVFGPDSLSLKSDGVGGAARITYDYSELLPAGDVPALRWDLTARLTDLPTQKNRFEWVLFSVEKEDGSLLKYLLSPDSDGRNINLVVQTFSDTAAKDSLSASVLESLQVLKPSDTWMDLWMQVFLSPDEGLFVRLSSADQGMTESLRYPVSPGMFRPEMEFLVRYTATKKAAYRWSLPTVSLWKETLPDLAYTDVRLTDEGLFYIRLNKPVSIDEASVSAPGFVPTLSQEAPDLLVVNIGAKAEEDVTLTLTISGLKDAEGRVESITLNLETYKDEDEGTFPDSPEIEGEEGIFLTELMVDPPITGPLRDLKYIEIYNHTSQTFPLNALLLRYRTQEFPLPPVNLLPEAYAVILPAGTTVMIPGEKVYLDAFPALSGDFPVKILEKASNRELDSYYFSSRSYEPGAPKSGWSVERVSLSPAMWRTSYAPDGGTPGKASSMKPFVQADKGEIILSEIALSSNDKGRKYLEFYNASGHAVSLSNFYLAYRKTPEGIFTPKRITTEGAEVPEKGYLVIAADSAALFQTFGEAVKNTAVVEKTDFPELSEDYTELELRSYRNDQLIDRAKYSSRWVGGDELLTSLERRFPPKDGFQKEAWGRSMRSGTPGTENQPGDLLSGDNGEGSLYEWPDDPVLSYDQMVSLLPLHRDRATLTLFTELGQRIAEAKGAGIEPLLESIRTGTAPFPSIPLIVRIKISHPDEDPDNPELTPPLTYDAVWLSLKR